MQNVNVKLKCFQNILFDTLRSREGKLKNECTAEIEERNKKKTKKTQKTLIKRSGTRVRC